MGLHTSRCVFILCPCDSSVGSSVLYSVVMQLPLFFYLSWLFHQLSQSHLWMTSMAVVLSALQPLLMASHAIHILRACLSDHCLGLPALFLLLPYILVWPGLLFLCCYNGFLHWLGSCNRLQGCIIGASFLQNCISSLTCRNIALQLTTDASVSRYCCSYSL